MIGFVEESPSQQVLAGHLEGLAGDVLRAHGDLLRAGHLLAKAGDAEAALLPGLGAFGGDNFGIDEH